MIRALIADDHAIFREGLAMLLTTMDDLDLAGQTGDGHEAVRLTKKLVPDLVVLDNSMPGISGMQAAEKILGMENPPKVVILTMYGEASIAAQALSMGVSGFLVKDSAFEELSRAIRLIMEGETFVSPELALKMLQDEGRDNPPPLTSREVEVLKLIALGHSNKETGECLHISPRTVDTHRTRIMKKLNVRSTAQMVRFAVKTGLIQP